VAQRTIGVVGLGIMGSAMSVNLAKAGFATHGYDIDVRRRGAAARRGVSAAGSVSELAIRAPVLLTSLPSPPALIDVANELAANKGRAAVVIETSTLPIASKEQAREILEMRGVVLLDCPLSGTGAQARTRDLAVYASGSRAAYTRCVPFFKGFARAHTYLGDFGNGSRMKFLANLLVAIHNVSTAEAVVLAKRAGIDPMLAVKVLGDGAGSSRMLQVRGPMMARGAYEDATMKVGLWQKDMKIIDDFARSVGSPTPLFDATESIYAAAMQAGYAEADTASVCAVLERLAESGKGIVS
jgi:3-hydroxyisobutyrate dehydrogenase-like beta-hydroxyacid dehydrogenase